VKDVSQSTALIFDHGLFLPLAQRLVGHFKRVLYHCPVSESFPKMERYLIGDGYDGVERVDDIWKVMPEVTTAIFPDIYDSGLQLHLESIGISVWGSRNADSLEINRDKFMRVLKEVGLEVPKFERVVGLTKLGEYLKDKEDKYIKISKFRGTLETTHWRNWRQDEGWLEHMAVKLGPAKDLLPFLVFDAIETDLEIGADTFTIDGQFPSSMLHGLEWKDKGYLGVVTPRDEMPDHVQNVIESFSPILKQYRCRNFMSMEIRVKDDVGYYIDPTQRCPCPATGSQLKLIGNLPEVIFAGANGELVEPEWTDKVSAECIMTEKGPKECWSITEFPKELQEHVFCGGSCEIDGRICSPPDDSDENTIGWLVATGSSIEQVVEQMKEYAAMLPDGVSAKTDSLFDLLKEAHSAEDEGIEFSDKEVPDPQIALTNES